MDGEFNFTTIYLIFAATENKEVMDNCEELRQSDGFCMRTMQYCFFKSVEEAEQLLTIINDTRKRFGLSISFKKTKTQVFQNKEMCEQESLFCIDGNVIDNVKELVYLGKEFSVESKHNSVQLQISKAMANSMSFTQYSQIDM